MAKVRPFYYILLASFIIATLMVYHGSLRRVPLCFQILKGEGSFLRKLSDCKALIHSPMADGLYLKYEYAMEDENGDFRKSFYFLDFDQTDAGHFRLVETHYGYREEEAEKEILDRLFRNSTGIPREAPNLAMLPLWVPPHILIEDLRLGVYQVVSEDSWRGYDCIVLTPEERYRKDDSAQAYYDKRSGFFVGLEKIWFSKRLAIELVKTNASIIRKDVTGQKAGWTSRMAEAQKLLRQHGATTK